MPASFPGPGHRYDLVVVGAGAAGSEAAWRAAGAGADVLLVTTSLDTVYAAPAERVRWDPPPGTLAAAVADALRPAADGTVGAWELHSAIKYRLEARPGLHLLQSNVDRLLVEGGRAVGVDTWEGVERRGSAVALCVGGFLRARLTIGAATEAAGRPGEMAYDDLADDLEARGLTLVAARDAGGGGGGEAPPWSVRFVRLSDDQTDDVSVVRLPGLYAAGICARGPLPYAAAVAEGVRLADSVCPGSALDGG